MNRFFYLFILAGFLTLHIAARSQQPDSSKSQQPAARSQQPAASPASDTVGPHGHPKSPYAVDSFAKKRHDPRKATIRSAIIPGWGQVYNRKYWKLPLVYAAIGIPAYTYFYNRTWYHNCQQAISIIDFYAQHGYSAVPDTAIAKLPVKLQPLVSYGINSENALRTYRNEYRKNEDYSVLFFLLFWGLNVVDATVDAHLMYFDVSDKLTMHLQQPSPGMGPGAGAAGVSLVFDLHKARYKPLSMQ